MSLEEYNKKRRFYLKYKKYKIKKFRLLENKKIRRSNISIKKIISIILIMLCILTFSFIYDTTKYSYSEYNIFENNEYNNIMSKYRDNLKKQQYLTWMKRFSQSDENTLLDIYNETSKYDNQQLLIILSKMESNFNPNIQSDKDVCLLQINYPIWEKTLKDNNIITHWKDLFNLDKCVESANFILNRYLLISNNNIYEAIRRYNGGGDSKYLNKFIKTKESFYKNITL